MHDEAAFLARIRETPDDVAPCLVYADWLDEHDDPRGELIRVTEEMRTLAPYSDAYWALKPRRKTLRQGVADEWLGALRYNDVWPIFTHGVPDDWKGRWRLLRELVERWLIVPLLDVGRPSDEVAAIEQRAGQTLSPTLREWLAFAFDMYAYNSRWSELHPEKLLPLGPFADTYWLLDSDDWLYTNLVLLASDCTHDEPPIYTFNLFNHIDEELRREMLQPTNRNLWEFAWEWCWQHLSTGKQMLIRRPDADRLLQQLTEFATVSAVVADDTYLENNNIIVRVHASDWNNNDFDIQVHVSAHAAPEEVPAFLQLHTDRWGCLT